MKNTFLSRVKGESKSKLTERYNQLKKEIEKENSNHSSFLLAQLKNDYDKLNKPWFINLIKSISYLQWLILISLFIILLIGLFPFLAQLIFNVEVNKDNGASFGDSYGVINALFSGLAFAGVIIALLMQNKDLNLTREELSKSVEAQNMSQIALHKQLNEMQRSSERDTINNYYELIKQSRSRNREDEYKCEQLISHFAKDILTDKRYFNILKPQFEVKVDKTSNGEYQIELTNVGPELMLVHFVFGNNVKILSSSKNINENLNYGGSLRILFDKFINNNYISIVYLDTAMNVVWAQNIYLSEDNRKFKVVKNEFKQLENELRYGL